MPAHDVAAQFSLLPKLEKPVPGSGTKGTTFYERQCVNYNDCAQISDTKLCSRIFKKVDKLCVNAEKGVNRDDINTEAECKSLAAGVFSETYRYDRAIELAIQTKIANRDPDTESYLACAILSGNVRLWMMPYYVRYMADFVLAIIGPVVIIIIIYGGYVYIVGGLGGEGEGAAKGKKIIFAGILGMVLIFAAWTIVNVISAILTG